MKSRRRFRRSQPSAPLWASEHLEDRTLLAGNVLASVTAAGNLLIRGDAQANQVNLQTTAGKLTVSGTGGTTINGGSAAFVANGVTGTVFVFLAGGGDSLKIGGTAATSIPHDLLVNTGSGDDTVDIENTSIGGNAWIFGSAGHETISVGSAASATPVTVGGNLFIEGGSLDSTLAVFDATITGNLCIIGNGNNDNIQVGFDAGLGIIGVTEDSPGHVNVDGNLTIRDGGNEMSSCFGTSFSCLDQSMNSCASSGGNDRSLKSLLGLATALFSCDMDSDDCDSSGGGSGCNVGDKGDSRGSISEKSCGESSGRDAGNWGYSWFCGGEKQGCNGSGNAGGGEHIAIADVTVRGNLKIKSHGGNDEVLIGAAHTPANNSDPMVANLVFGDVSVSGNVRVRTGAGNDTLATVGLTVTGNTSINTGAGNDHIAVVESTGAFKGSFTLDSGAGNDAVVLSDSDAFQGLVTLRLGKGNDTLWLASDQFQKAVTIDGGAGNDTFLQSQSTFPNSFPAGSPTLTSIESNMPNVTPSDPVVVAAFSWFSMLLGV